MHIQVNKQKSVAHRDEFLGLILLKYHQVIEGTPAPIKFSIVSLFPMQCLVDMQGRFFGGRTVHACFFDEERFDKNDLAPRAEEVRR